jgi:hypothetical protein
MHACIGVFESFFFILHLSFVAFANTFTVTFVFENTFTINMCGFSDQFRSGGSSTKQLFLINRVLGFEILDWLPRQSHASCKRVLTHPLGLLCCTDLHVIVGNQLVILHRFSNVAQPWCIISHIFK